MLIRELSTIERSETRSLTGHEVTCSLEQRALALALWAKKYVIINKKGGFSMATKSVSELEKQAEKLKAQQVELRKKIKRAKEKELLKQARELVAENSELKKENEQLKKENEQLKKQVESSMGMSRWK